MPRRDRQQQQEEEDDESGKKKKSFASNGAREIPRPTPPTNRHFKPLPVWEVGLGSQPGRPCRARRTEPEPATERDDPVE